MVLIIIELAIITVATIHSASKITINISLYVSIKYNSFVNFLYSNLIRKI